RTSPARTYGPRWVRKVNRDSARAPSAGSPCTRPSWNGQTGRRSSCTVCLRTAVKRWRAKSSTARKAVCGTKPKIACTSRRQSWRHSSAEKESRGASENRRTGTQYHGAERQREATQSARLSRALGRSLFLSERRHAWLSDRGVL